MLTLEDHRVMAAKRSRDRTLVTIALARLSQATIGRLARETGVRWVRVRAALEGGMPGYADDRSLVALRIAKRVRPLSRTYYTITPDGRRFARALATKLAHDTPVREILALACEAPPAQD